jgi:NADH-quinone oxidoreductase subunit L
MHEHTWGYIWLIPFFPMVGAVINGLFGRRFGRGMVYAVGCGSIFLSFCVSVGGFLALRALDPSQRVLTQTLFEWVAAGSTKVDLAYLLDPLSCVMILVVTGVGFLIHVYSTGYMGHDPDYARFFTYLNLFCFAMLTLVLGSNFLVMFVGWEGVGLCSYLLIGFWFEDPDKAAAGMKAFIVNRIGDFGFLLGMFLVFVHFGTLDFRTVMSQAPHVLAVGGVVVTAITLLMFVGATGKSAQIPLYVWLPDAMAGPTPVSALIHAATMVTAGVYMIGRCNVLFSMAPTSMATVATIGAVTAIYAGTIALTQNDIKKVLAYSTVSQLGYMFIGMGVGAYAAGIFHLMTHAFFKACLFLGSGSVIHGMHEEQDMRKMGGLRKYMPHTYLTFLIATIAIAGVPPLAAFFSKDEILWKAWDNGFRFQWFLGFAAAGVTAFYMFRLVFMTFFGKERFDPHEVHVHESPKSMYMPLYVLAVLSIVGGWVGIPAALGGANHFHHWLMPVTDSYSSSAGAHAAAEMVGDGGLGVAVAWASGDSDHGKAAEGHAAPAAEHGAAAPGHGEAAGAHHYPAEYILMFLSVAYGLLGILMAYFLYLLKPEIPKNLAERFKAFYELLLNKYYVDEIYQAVFVDTCLMFATFCHAIWDVVVIDGIVNGAGFLAKAVGGGLRQVQTGKLQGYALTILFGVVVVVAYYAIAAAF